MTCEQFENRFLLDSEYPPSAEERTAGEQHLAHCPGCQTLTRQLQQLDAALTIKITAPALSGDFKQRLAKRIQAVATVLPEAQRAELRRQLQAEYEAGMEHFRHAPLRLPDMLDGLPYVVLAALVGWLAWQFLPGLINVLSAQGLSGATQNLLLAVVAGAVFLGIGLTFALRQTSRQQWSLR